MLSSSSLAAHVVEQLYAEVEAGDSGWRIVIQFDAGYALPEMRADPAAPAPRRDWLVGLSEQQHAELCEEALRYLRDWVTFRVNREPVPWTPSFPDWDPDPPAFPVLLNEGAYFRIALAGDWPPHASELSCELREGDFPNLLFQVAPRRFLTVRPGQRSALAQSGTTPVPPTANDEKKPPWPLIASAIVAVAIVAALVAARAGRPTRQ